MSWETMKWRDLHPEPPRRFPTHLWRKPAPKLPWLECCGRCGLVPLKNERTRQAIRAGCFA